MATKPTPDKPERPMPDTPEELAQAIFRDADRKLVERQRLGVRMSTEPKTPTQPERPPREPLKKESSEPDAPPAPDRQAPPRPLEPDTERRGHGAN